MTDTISSTLPEAVSTIMRALDSLTPEERGRVLKSMGALYDVPLEHPSKDQARAGDPNPSNSEPSPRTGGERPSEKPLSLVEFLNQVQPKTNPQRIAAFASFRETHEGREHFSRRELEPYFAAAKLRKPANYDRDFSAAARDGWIHEDGDKSYLTQNGEKAVHSQFSAKTAGRSTAGSGKKNVKSAKAD